MTAIYSMATLAGRLVCAVRASLPTSSETSFASDGGIRQKLQSNVVICMKEVICIGNLYSPVLCIAREHH